MLAVLGRWFRRATAPRAAPVPSAVEPDRVDVYHEAVTRFLDVQLKKRGASVCHKQTSASISGGGRVPLPWNLTPRAGSMT
jgi:hypothetical protein